MKRPSDTRHGGRPATPGAGGFTLLELVVVVSILAVLAGMAVPVARRALDRAARGATRAELDLLADAAAEHFRDTWRLPRGADDLLSDPGVPGWTGPYLAATGRDASGGSSAALDAWSRPYAFVRRGASVLEIASPGPDGVPGEGEDPAVTLDVTPLRRERTLERLGTLNAAVERYNRAWLGTDDLAPPFSAVLAKLVARGYLPAGTALGADGWGEPFECDPPGGAPVVRVTSRSLRR